MNENYALLIALALLALAWAFYPRRRPFQDELDENAERVKKERLEKMQK